MMETLIPSIVYRNRINLGRWLLALVIILLGVGCRFEPSASSVPVPSATSANTHPTGSPTYFPDTTSPLFPSARSGAAMVYDSRRKVAVLFGGGGETGVFGDTWEYDGTRWHQILTPQAPSPRYLPVMSYDPDSDSVVLYGGQTENGTVVTDTWQYDGRTWTALTAKYPTPRTFIWSTMAFDPTISKHVLYGPQGRADGPHETWLFDTERWQRSEALIPGNPGSPALLQATMAYDSSRGRLVLQGVGPWTYEWNGSSWSTALIPESAGALPRRDDFRVNHRMVYDLKRQVVVMYGWAAGSSLTWEYDGERWTAVTVPNVPPPRSDTAMVYDERQGVVLMFGGITPDGEILGDLWAFDGERWLQR